MSSKDDKPAPRRRALLLRVLLVAPWVVLLVLGAEFATVLTQYALEQRSPYVLALTDNQPWPRSDAGSELVSTAPKASDVKLPLPSPVIHTAALAAYLHAEDDTGFYQFGAMYPCELADFRDGSPTPARTHPKSGLKHPPVEAWREGLGQQPVLAGVPAPRGAVEFRVYPFTWEGNAWRAVQFVPAPGAGVAEFLLHDLPFEAAPEESPYLRPFYSFKPHGVAPAGTTYFGVPEFRLNNFGFRDDDVAVPRPADTFRVACVGASTTMEGAVNGFTYPNLVERFLREAFPGKSIEVVNCGLSGINTIGERMRTTDYLMLEPNAIVLYDGVNDICHNHLRTWRTQLGRAGHLAQESRLLSWLFSDYLIPDTGAMRTDYEARGLGNMLALADYVSDCGVTPYVCTFAHPDTEGMTREERAYYERDARLNWVGKGYTLDTYLKAVRVWNDLVREICAARKLAVVDVAAQLSGGGQVFGDICHMKDYGIEQKARIVAEALKPQAAAFFGGGAGAH